MGEGLCTGEGGPESPQGLGHASLGLRLLQPCLLPRPACCAAQGPVPSCSLPPECPGLSPAQTCPGSSRGPSFSCPLGHGHHSSPSFSPPLSPPPGLASPAPTLLPLQTHVHRCSGRPVQPLALATNPTVPRSVESGPAWGCPAPRFTCSSHLAGPIHTKPQPSTWW